MRALRPAGNPTRASIFLLLVLACVLPQSLWAEWTVPAVLKDKVAALPEEQQDFLGSGTVLEFIPERQLEHELATRDSAAMRDLLEDLMELARAMAYDPSRDMGAIPLNLNSRRFQGGTLPTPEPLREFKREPGPFSVHRYLYPGSGVPTFAGAPVAVWPEDLVAGAVDVAIIGVPNNMSSGRRDAGNGPNAMRALDTIAVPDSRSLIKPLEAMSVVDYGDFSIDGLSTERSAAHVSDMVAETAATGAIPMLVGGDTSMLYAGVRGVAEARGDRAFGLLHFSAHPDAVRDEAHTITDRQAVFALIDQGIVDGDAVVQVGLRGPDLDVATLQWLRSQRVRYHTMAEIGERGIDRVMQRVLRELKRGPGAYFVSVDVSVLDPSELSAAGRLVSSGLRLADVAPVIREVCAAYEIVGFEITDLAPMLDSTRLSVSNANALLNACLNGIAVRKSGLKADYVHPLALDHGQR